MTDLPAVEGPGSVSLIGPPTADIAERAKACVMNFYVRQAEKDGVPATQRAMYTMKLQDARTYLAGMSPDNPNQTVPALIAGEARIRSAQTGRDVQPFEVATKIVGMATQFEELELTRLRVNAQIDNAGDDVEAIIRILDASGIALT